jgi:hypothetical protein
MTPSPAATSIRSEQRALLIWSIGGGALGRLGPFVAVGYLAAQLPNREFARLAAAVLTVQSLSGVFSSAVATAANRLSSARAKIRRGVLVDDAALPLAAAALVSVLGSLVAPAAYKALTSQVPGAPVLLAGTGVGAVVLTDSLIGVMAGRRQVRAVAMAEGSRGLLCMITMVLLATTRDPTAGALGIGAADLIVGIHLLRMLHSRSEVGWRWSELAVPAWVRRTVAAGVTANAFAQAGLWGTQLILARGFGLEAIAAYSLANRFASLSLILPGFLTKNMLGLMAHEATAGTRAFRRQLINYVTVVSLLAGASGLVVIVIGALLFDRIFGAYPSGFSMLIVLVLSSIPSAIGSALGVACVVKGYLLAWILSDAAFAACALAAAAALHGVGQSASISLCGLILAYLANIALRVFALRGVSTGDQGHKNGYLFGQA